MRHTEPSASSKGAREGGNVYLPALLAHLAAPSSFMQTPFNMRVLSHMI